MSRLKDLYKDEIVDAMIKKFGYKNIMEVPKLDKIVINMGVGEAKENAKVLDSAVKDLRQLLDRRLFLPERKIPLLTSKSVRVCRSDARQHFAARKCMTSWIVWLTLHCLVSATSAA